MGITVTLRGGSGDMKKSTYDPNLDGVIDVAETEADMTKAVFDPDADNKIAKAQIHNDLDKDNLVDATKTLFIPSRAIYQAGSTHSIDSAFPVIPFLNASDTINAEFVVPSDYVSGGALKMVCIAKDAVNKRVNFSSEYAAHDVWYKMGVESSNNVSSGGNTPDDIYITTLHTFTGLTLGDVVGMLITWISGNINVIGLQFSYTANK